MRWDLAVPAVAAVGASTWWAMAARRAGNQRTRKAWRYQSAAGALWALSAVAWLSGAPTLAGLGRAGFLWLAAIGFACLGRAGSSGRGLTSRAGGDARPRRRSRARVLLGGAVAVVVGLVLAGGPIAAAAGQSGARLVLPLAGLALGGLAAVRTRRAGERATTAWTVAGFLAIAAADFDAGRGAGSAGLGWLLGFGCLAMAAHSYRGTPSDEARRRALAASRSELLDLARHASPAGRPSSGRPAAGVRPGGVLMVEHDAIYEAKRDGRDEVPAP